ncbi:CorA family divalent cation transporter [Planobacterium oryzisoli]|uniref:Magnesium transporter CorA n=1 Tax=Planobacterium oryzisoli TaxID=2771435 RepID=A0A930YVZ5_9FLAO|nr:CorA family divalent cation transporter [Planobacterium oryzisoli]MBF5027418.1 magnesium transporter CorA [Planobacterium oryzisoli]
MPIKKLLDGPDIQWIDVLDPQQEDLDRLHSDWGIEKLLLADTIDTNHLPKYEKSGEVHFFLYRQVYERKKKELTYLSDVSSKLGIFLMGKTLITIHRYDLSCIEKSLELHHKQAFTSPDGIVLHLATEILFSYDQESIRLMEIRDRLENQIFLKHRDSSNKLKALYQIKRKAALNTRILLLFSEMVEAMSKLKLKEAEVRELKDRYHDAISDFEHLNSEIINLISMFLALSDQKANQVMKMLAIYSMYFLPITFVAGVYGMNFTHMPELSHPWGYAAVLGLIVLLVLTTYLYVRSKKW